MPDDEFEDRHPGLDGLAEAHVVGNQQIDPRHLDRTHHRIKLIIFDVNSAAERGLDRLYVSSGSGSPAHGIEECVESNGIVVACRVGERNLLDDLGSWFQFPEDLQLLSESVVFDR